MEISLSGRSAIVTGGSKGIGLAVATRFAKSGADVAIVARGKESLDEAVAAIKKTAKARVIGVQADVGLAADIQRAYDEVMKAFGKVDIIVNNAGTSRAMPFEKMTDEILHGDIEQKLFAAVRLIRLVAPQMKERRWGRIINVLNIGAKAPRPNSMPTSVSRAAGMAMTKALSAEFAPHNVLVNAMLVGLHRGRSACAGGEEGEHPDRRLLQGAREGDSARPRRQGGGVRQSGLLPRLRPGRLHHRHRDQRRWRPLAGGVTLVHTRREPRLILPARGGMPLRRSAI